MNIIKTSIVWTFAALFALTPVFAERPDETLIGRLLEEFQAAHQQGDLDYLADALHPNSLAAIRRSALIDLENLEKSFSESEVERLLGSPRRDLSALSDSDFFIYIGSLLMDFRPPSRPQPDLGRIHFLGIIPDGDIHYAFYRVKHTKESESDRVDLRRPLLLAFRQSNDKWKVHTMMYANSIEPAFQRELLRQRRLRDLEQDSDGNAGKPSGDEPTP